MRAALETAFAAAPALKGYVLDEQGGVRKHVAVFVNGDMLQRDIALDNDQATALFRIVQETGVASGVRRVAGVHAAAIPIARASKNR